MALPGAAALQSSDKVFVMIMALARTTGFVLFFGGLATPLCWAGSDTAEGQEVVQKVNMHGFTFAEQALAGRLGKVGYAFLLSDCPGKDCVTLSGLYEMPGNSDSTTLSVEGSDCRPKLQGIGTKTSPAQRIILTVPPVPACAGVPQKMSGEYFPVCSWDARGGDLSWTGWRKHYKCWPESGKPHSVGPR